VTLRNLSQSQRVKFCSRECYYASKRFGADQFWARVDKSGACWLWTGGTHRHGHGLVRRNRWRAFAHRYAWELLIGPIPDGMNVCHNCPGGDNPRCVNPAHLFLGTQADNMRDMGRKDRVAFGERSGGAKLTEEQVRAIRRRRADGLLLREVADEFGCSMQQVSRIVRGELWRRLE